MSATSTSDPHLEMVANPQWKLLASIVITIFLGGWATLAAVQVTAKNTVDTNVTSLSQTIKANELYSKSIVDRFDIHLDNEKLYREADARDRAELRAEIRGIRDDLRQAFPRLPILPAEKNTP